MNTEVFFQSEIPGATNSAGKPLDVNSPYHDQRIATVATANAAGVEQALKNAAAIFSDRKHWLTVEQRIAILERSIELMRERAEELAIGASDEGGKPLIDSRIEMARCIDSIRICIDSLRNETNTSPVMGINAASRNRHVMIENEPIGVVVAISAFNHPLNLIAHQIGPAIASGCPVIVKPAEDTPLSCIRLASLLHQAGLPQAWCQVVIPESVALAEKMATDPRVAFLSFIGSAKVGWHLRSKLPAGTRCALEHGGVAPVIFTRDANIEQALPGLLKGAFYHAGQVCVSVQRIFAHASIATELAEKMANAAKALSVGDPLCEQTEIGPLIRAKEVERMDLWVKDAVASGARLLCGGNKLEHHCYAPTVLFKPPQDASVSTREVFGPVVCIYPFNELDTAIEAANALDVAFQASVYSPDMDTALYISRNLAASAVMINDHTAFRVDWMPFSGLKHSGLGTGGIPYTMRDMQIEKMTVIHSDGLA
ncbi:MAG: aldehyde dehydrogenase family protein [Mariprofundaceae bacterium]|nr:aldehyde dehydrogenase family protein [Mariprofundaceae bacterium]